MTGGDPWIILGLSREAGDQEIKERYRQLAREMHPDRNRHDPEAGARFQEIAVAYEAIRSEKRRQRWQADHESPIDFRPPEGNQDIEISFLEAFEGSQKPVTVFVDDICRQCGGSGAAPGSSPRRCTECEGRGEVILGEISSSCGHCGGHGYFLPHPCPHCNLGRLQENREMLLQIPSGIASGQTLVLSEGPQNFAFRIIVQPSPIFERRPDNPADLLLRLPLSYSEALLGASVRIPTPERIVELQIPRHTTTGKRFRVSGEGMPRYEGDGRGDLYVDVLIAIPDEVSRRHEEIARQLAQEENPEKLRLRIFRPED